MNNSNFEKRIKSKVKRVKKIPGKYLVLVLFISCFLPLYSQDIGNLPITLPSKELSIEMALTIMKQQQNVIFSYNNDLLANKEIHFEKTKLTIVEIVKIISAEVDMSYRIQGNKIILYPKKKKFSVRGNIKDAATGAKLPVPLCG